MPRFSFGSGREGYHYAECGEKIAPKGVWAFFVMMPSINYTTCLRTDYPERVASYREPITPKGLHHIGNRLPRSGCIN